MAEPFIPEHPRGWLQTLLTVAERATPVTLFLLMIIGALVVYGMLGELRRVHGVNSTLWQHILTCQREQIELAKRCDGAEK